MNNRLAGRWAKPLVFLMSLDPVFVLLWRGLQQNLGANPIEFITRSTGDWTLRFLLLTLAISPLRKLPRMSALIRFRRMLGLFSFFYGSLHLATYLWFDKFFVMSDIAKDFAGRPFITAGFTAFLVMLPLTVTSTQGWIRRLGGRRWQLLHRLAYASLIAGALHYYWLTKSDVRLPLLYAFLASVLLLFRVAKARHAASLFFGGPTSPTPPAQNPAPSPFQIAAPAARFQMRPCPAPPPHSRR